MRVNRLSIASLLCTLPLISGLAAQAQNATLTFEGQSNTIYNVPILRSGYDIGNPTGQEQHFHEIDSTIFPTFVPNNGTGVLYNDRDTQIFVKANAGSGFTLFSGGSVDVATDLNGGAGGSSILQIAGLVGNVQTGVLNINLSQTGSFTTVDLTPLGNIDQLLFDGIPVGGGNGGFTFDNLTLRGPGNSAVPEPGSVALLTGMSMTGAAFLRRRKKTL